MEYGPCISQIATLLADPKRSAMIWALMDGTARPADELAILAGLSTSSAGAHLARLTSGGLFETGGPRPQALLSPRCAGSGGGGRGLGLRFAGQC